MTNQTPDDEHEYDYRVQINNNEDTIKLRPDGSLPRLTLKEKIIHHLAVLHKTPPTCDTCGLMTHWRTINDTSAWVCRYQYREDHLRTRDPNHTQNGLTTETILDDDPLGEHLQTALQHAEDNETKYSIRSAMQHRVIELESDHVRGPCPVDSHVITGP